MGHAPEVQVEEVRYFRVLARFGFVPIMTAALNSFWSGRSRTRVVMGLELLAAALNVVLNRLLIFGGWGFPRLGIHGAGLATGLSGMAALAVGLALFLAPCNRSTFGTWPARTFDPGLFRRLIRFGLPNGVQFLLDMAAFNLFIVFLGQAGKAALEAANQAFGINALAFIPILGFGMTASILVGQAIGARDIPAARRAVRAALSLALLYMAVMGLVFTCFPGAILAIYRRPGDPEQAAVLDMAARSLRYITAYLLFDALFVVYSNAIKGAGDTRFTMVAIAVLSWGTLVLPCYLARRAGASVWFLWRLFVAHVVLCGAVFYLRYRGGRWQTMRVVEEGAPPLEP
jgi:multidrug resistance protein, MATE family